MHFDGVDPSARILCLGNNDHSTDQSVAQAALHHGTVNHGLVTQADFVPSQPGFYHTTVTDIPWGGLIELASGFDTIIMLDQPQQQWSHWKCLQATCKLMLKLESLGKHTVFRSNENVQHILYWIDLVYNKNSSICIYPWINLNNNKNHLRLCARDRSVVTKIDNLQDWQTDAAFGQIRQAMLRGEPLPKHCAVCYDYEAKGMESYRQFETIDWITALEIKDVADLAKLKHPHFYEVSTGNHCNIKCRGCQPAFSQSIGQELKKFNIKPPRHIRWTPDHYNLDRIDVDTLNPNSSVYFQGGEPTIMPEVRNFMQRCIDRGRTDFFLTMCTNGVKFAPDFLDLLTNFSNVNFSFSIDGYDRVNDYWRSGSQWQRVIENARLMQSLGHSVSINTVPGIYNVTNLHLLLQFLDREFPFTAIYMQVNYIEWQSAFNHPMPGLVLDSMQKCQQTSVYHSNGKSCKTAIDSIFHHYSHSPRCDLTMLKQFFDYNDQLDLARGTRLADYIPELELARSFVK